MSAWTLEMADTDDPYGHRARAVARPDGITWDVTYYRGDEVTSEGIIGTPAPHNRPPVATLMGTLEGERHAADWRERHPECDRCEHHAHIHHAGGCPRCGCSLPHGGR